MMSILRQKLLAEPRDRVQRHDAGSRWRLHRLQWVLALVVTLSVALPALMAGALLIYENYQKNMAQKSRATAERYADLLQAGMSVPLWNISADLGKPIIESVVVDSDVLKIAVRGLDLDNFLVYESPQFKTTDTANRLHIERTVVYGDQQMGTVELVYSLAQAKDKAKHESFRLMIIISLQLVTSILVLSIFLQKRVMTPVARLRDFAQGITQGDLKSVAPRLQADEFGDLALELETMRQSLEQNIHTLEAGVQARTVELSRSNEQLSGALEQLKHTQGNLIQSEKLAALGSLVAGIAHELNTPIGNGLTVASTLNGTCSEFSQKLAAGMTRTALQQFVEDVTQGNQIICRNLQKASELVSGFKQVAMDRTSAQRRKFVLQDFLQDTHLTLMPMFRRTPFECVISCEQDIEMDSYPGPLGQVITNLLNNAIIHAFDEMPSGCVSVTAQQKGSWVCIEVKDNGKGIKAEHVSRIFDPFFTTKLGAGGNGLGMHIVHNIVTGLLGGDISLQSTLGIGTCFTLRIPQTAPSSSDEDATLTL
jgi:two-component system, NtrC family, sensor kinase